MRKEFPIRWLLDPEARRFEFKIVSVASLPNFDTMADEHDSFRRLRAKICQVSKIGVLLSGAITDGFHKVAQREKGVSWLEPPVGHAQSP